ncbi:hypothetical protein SHKM778_86240 [Streptomyces sp. KM77-8]|uniref:Uncharacterized protein n=1 Tax=Streptomyces haneummycinicus TaxID=3074435 RepID=A0AAT9HXB0_9ACTN
MPTGSTEAASDRPPQVLAGLQELQPVAHRVLGVETPVAREVVVPGDRGAVGGQPGRVGLDAGDQQARVGLSRGAEAGLDAQVEAYRARLEPAAAACREGRGFGTSVMPRTST